MAILYFRDKSLNDIRKFEAFRRDSNEGYINGRLILNKLFVCLFCKKYYPHKLETYFKLKLADKNKKKKH